jgi:hypothetical protein
MRGREGVSAENHNPSGQSDGAPDGAAEPTNHAPDSTRGKVVASHGEREKRAYVAPVDLPKRQQRLNTVDMSKVRISPDMKVQQLDPRSMATQKMDIPPGGIRPLPPPAYAEVADVQSQPQPGAAAASPWSQNAGIDRSMLPSAAMAPPPTSPAARLPSMPPTRSKSATNYGPAIWIAVVVLAALIGGGVAFALRNGASTGGADLVSSSAPIAFTVPGVTPTTDTTAEPEVIELDESETTDDAGTPSTKTQGTRPVQRRPSTTTKTTTTTTAPAPTSTTTARPRLFN